MNEQELKEELAKIPPEERAKFWEDRVRNEVSAVLDTYLPEAITGNIGIKYDHPVIEVSPKTGKALIDNTKAIGVKVIIEFTFAEPIQFFEKE